MVSMPFLPDRAEGVVADPVSAEGGDIVLLMDSSGSMKKTDPQDYRKAAARLFISLLSSSDRVGIISFGDSARELLPLTQNTGANRGRLSAAVNRISSKESTTNIHEGVKKGFEELGSSQRKQRIMLLMSDGKLTLGSKEKDEAALQELLLLLPEITKAQIKLYTIAFTELSDMKLLGDMAQETAGFSRIAETDKDIHLIFASIFEQIKSPDTVPIEGDTFSVDKEINEAIILVSKQEGTSTTLIDPSGNKSTSARFGGDIEWFESKLFDMITVKKPATGTWKLNLSTKEGNRVYVITDLKLKGSFDKGYVHRGEEVRFSAWLEKESAMLTAKEVLDQVAFRAVVSRPDGSSVAFDLQDTGQSGDEKAGDGIYSRGFVVDSPGDYALTITAEGKTFKREKTWQFISTDQPAVPEKKAVEKKTAPLKKASEATWMPVLIKVGSINLVLIVVVLCLLFMRKRKARKSNPKEVVEKDEHSG
ncbi:MAG: VWA domain-containing protein [Nitrospirales bacterium]|nr:VWA domain-containing protein [Nitrospirales bacterium]